MAPITAGRGLGLFGLVLLLATPAGALAEPVSSPSIQRLETGGATRDRTCASRYHARLAEIAGGELAAYREARATIGEVDPALPGRLVFSDRRRPDLGPEARGALELGAAQARAQGRGTFARDANTRWIAERIREDLSDYLRQKETPFLCAGVEPYLSTLSTYAAQGAPSPSRIAEALETQRRVASRSLDTAFRAMRPAPRPRFAPADRPTGPQIAGLRLALEMGPRERDGTGEPMRLAERPTPSAISQSQTDPDLPPLGRAALRPLESDAERMRAITALLGTARRHGLMAESGPLGTRATGPRPVLARLVAVRAHLDAPQGRIADPIVRPLVELALSDLEVLDYLDAAASATGDPMTRSMYATMEAIRAAHADACDCAD